MIIILNEKTFSKNFRISLLKKSLTFTIKNHCFGNFCMMKKISDTGFLSLIIFYFHLLIFVRSVISLFMLILSILNQRGINAGYSY